MKIRKLAIVATVFVIVIAGAYAGTTFYLARQTEAALTGFPTKMTERAQILKVTANDYHRGFLTSTHDVTVELADMPLPAGMKSPSVTLHSVISHGPFPDFGAPGMARIEQTLVFDEATNKIIAKAFGGASPLTLVTTVGLAGDGTTVLTGAPLNYKAGEDSVVWQGLSGTLQFTKDLASYDVEVNAPGLAMTCSPGCTANMKAFSFKSHSVKMPNMEIMSLGTAEFRLAEASVMKDGKPAFALKGATASSDASSKDGEFLDFVGRFAVAEITVGDFAATKAAYDFSAKHWHAPSFEKLMKAMQEAQKTAIATAGKGKPDPAAGAAAAAQMMQVFATNGLAFLQKDPVISIDRIGFSTKDGDVQLNVTAHFAGVTAADMQNPMGLIVKIQADGNAKVPEVLIANYMAGSQLGAMKAQGHEATPEEQEQIRAQARAAIEPKIAELALQGYLARENGILSAKASFKGGQLLVNDKPFGPGGAPPQ